MATIKEIARECNVSTATVSNILNGKGRVSKETRQLVLEKVKKLDYVPNVSARNLKLQATRMIGVITEDLTVFNTPEIVDGIDEYLEEHDYGFMLGNLRIYKKYGSDFGYHEDFKAQLNEELSIMKAKQVEGIIYVSAHSRDLSGVLGQDPQMPRVVVYGNAVRTGIPSIVFDDKEAAYQIVGKLAETGTDKIGVLAGDQRSVHTMERLIGCQRAMFENKILFDPELVYYGNWSRKFGYEAAEKLLAKGVRTFFSMNDTMAAGAYDCALDHGLSVGNDLSIGGIGNESSDYMRPKLTTIEMPLFDMGRLAGEKILSILGGLEIDAQEVSRVQGHLLNEEDGSIMSH